MKPLSELFLECHDAKVFADKSKHELLSRVYFKDPRSQRVLESNKYFIIGEKGTVKTIILQYLSNIKTEINASIIDFSQIEFSTFRNMIEAGYLKVTPMDQIWKLLLLVIAAEIVYEKEKTIFGYPKFKSMKILIDKFYENRF